MLSKTYIAGVQELARGLNLLNRAKLQKLMRECDELADKALFNNDEKLARKYLNIKLDCQEQLAASESKG